MAPDRPALSNPNDGLWVSTEELVRLRFQARRLRLLPRSARSRSGSQRAFGRHRGLEYQESREYQAGDDRRQIDWRVTARTQRVHTKLYAPERQQSVILLVDFSPTLFFGTGRVLKSVFAARLAALIGWITVLNGNRIGAVLWRHERIELRPVGGNGVLTLIHHLVTASEPHRGWRQPALPGLSVALQQVQRVAHTGSHVMILSDLYGCDAGFEVALSRLRAHNTVWIGHLLDRVEQELPPARCYGISDGQRYAPWDLRTQAARQAFLAQRQAHQQRIQTLCRRAGVGYDRLDTHGDIGTWALNRL